MKGRGARDVQPAWPNIRRRCSQERQNGWRQRSLGNLP